MDNTNHIAMNRWGKDHWSMLAYIETLNVDGTPHVGVLAKVNGNNKGIPETLRMRIDIDRHPALWGSNTDSTKRCRPDTGQKYPTRCKDGEVNYHDDMDCAEDL
jgi:hypothetical protein